MSGHQHVARWSWLLVLATGTMALGAEPNTKKSAEPPIIEEVLLEPTNLDLNDVALTEFVALLKERYRIPVVLDRASLEDAGVPLDAHVTCQLKDVALRSAITWTLAAHAMDWSIHDDVLLLTTQAKVNETMSTMVHDVSDFIPARDPKEDADPESTMKRLSQLAEVVQSTVLPDSWKDAGGDASIKPLEVGAARVLVVFQNRRGHEAVAMVLDDLAYCSEEMPAGSPKRSHSTQAKVTSFRQVPVH